MIKGFTLIEMSIVLVIIGLIVGGILVGQDLISAAAVRTQITQLEKYNTATNTFRGKYGYLPGDIPNPYASQFGFITRGTGTNAGGQDTSGGRGEGDGNGVIEGVGTGICNNAPPGILEAWGETLAFWIDLSSANLIDGGFHGVGYMGGLSIEQIYAPLLSPTSTPPLSSFLPSGKIGNGNYIYVWSGGITGGNGINYFGLSTISFDNCFVIASSPGLSVTQAANIDKKIDDGYPMTGSVTAMYLDSNTSTDNAIWAGASGSTPTSPSPSTCYDNGGSGTGIWQYSTSQNQGSGVNCALSFKFQ